MYTHWSGVSVFERVEIHYHVHIQVFDGSFERKTCGRLLHLENAIYRINRGGRCVCDLSCHVCTCRPYLFCSATHLACFVPPFATEEGPFGAETFC